jgi:hypothetical protein
VNIAAGRRIGPYEITAVIGDGHRFIVNTKIDDENSALITLVTNWPELLEESRASRAITESRRARGATT